MSVQAHTPLASLDWQRVIAVSTSLALHVFALAIVAIPIAMPLPRLVPKVAEVRIFEAEPPPPALPIPPEPLPLERPRPDLHPVIAPPVPNNPVPTTTAAVATPVATVPVATAPVSSVAGNAQGAPGAGETRVLAYDGSLRLKYPVTSVRLREQGTVLLRVLVDSEGNVQRIEIERGSGHPQLDAAAREAVRQAHFRPVLRDGQPVSAWGMVPIEFRLDRT